MRQTTCKSSQPQRAILCSGTVMSVAMFTLLPLSSAGQIGSTIVAQRRFARQAHEESRRIVDLSHTLSDKSPHWPGLRGFSYTADVDGHVKSTETNKSYYAKAYSICTAIHFGTHVDAPRHFNAKGWTVDDIPLERLVDVPLTVIDVSEKVAKERDYVFAKDDFVDHASKEPLVSANSVVFVYTGMSKLFERGAKAYLGTDSKNLSEMSLPGFGVEAANFLVSQSVYGVGLDSVSADSSRAHSGRAIDPQAHVAFTGNNIYILENLNENLSQLVTFDVG